MYSKELEEIIDAALADGEITEKERAVLHKRAIAEGVDPDELDVVIEGRLAKMQKVEKDWLRPSPPPFVQQQQNSKYGIVEKCPQCGAVVEAGSIKCTECGYAFRGIKAVSSVEKFSEQLLEIERRHGDKGLASNVVGSFLSAFGSDAKSNEISTFIRNFPIPNGKEDLLEFLMFLKPKAKVKIYTATPQEKALAPAYEAKYNECVIKARTFFGDDPQIQKVLPTEKKGLFGGLFGKKK